MRVGFGDCLLDSETRELLVNGQPVHLQPKAFQFLELLLESRPKAVSKEKIHEHLWPGTFVSDSTLTSLLAEIRAAIRDEAHEPRFVRTVHRFGYAFCGEATEKPDPTRRGTGAEFHCRVAWEDREIALSEGENVLGRDPAAAVWIDLESVSRRHARIVVTESAATIEDLGSRNGTYVDGDRVQAPVGLADGSKIKVGGARLVFRCFRGLGSTRSDPSSGVR